jgi:hypothetical protein
MTKRDRQTREYAAESYEKGDEIRTNSTTIRDTTPAVGSVQRDLIERLRRWVVATDAVPASDLMDEAADEIARLREAIRRLADQDATLSVQGGCVIVEMECQVLSQKNLTDEERDAVEWFAEVRKPLTRLTQNHNREKYKATLRGLLERTNHDAVPDAKANAESVAPQPTAGDRSGNPTSHSGTGNTQKPVAWARFFPNGGPMSVFLDRPPADSEPLYRHPLCQDSLQKNLTEAEHDALEFAVETGRVAIHDEATLRNLLERLK